MAQGLFQNLDLMGQPECYFSSLPEELEGKRDRLAAILKDVGMTPVIPEGGYFMLVDVSSLSECECDSCTFTGDLQCPGFPCWFGNIPRYCVFLTDLDLSHGGEDDDDDEAYDYKFVKWMIKEKVIHMALWL